MDIGTYEVEIESHTISIRGNKEAVILRCIMPDNERIQVPIWLTAKSMGIAKRSLKMCGFEWTETNPISDLTDKSTLLAGNRFTILVEEYAGKLRPQVLLDTEPTKKRLAEIQGWLRTSGDGEAGPQRQDASPREPEDDTLPF